MAKENKVFSDTATCKICGEEVKLRQAKFHLKKCREKNPLPTSTKKAEIFMLRIRGKYQKDYVLVVEQSGNQSLSVLDRFLRSIWLECCGHLSAFTIRKESYDCLLPEFEFPWGKPHHEMSKAKLSEVLTPDLKFTYEYDFGSTTDLELEVLDSRETLETLPTEPFLLMRNKPPQYKCDSCGKPATVILPLGYESENGELFCTACAEGQEEEEDDEEEFYGMRLVNSPRTGVCGYDTET